MCNFSKVLLIFCNLLLFNGEFNSFFFKSHLVNNKLIHVVSVILTEAKTCNNKDSEEADICMSRMLMIGDRSQRFRETLDEMHGYCKYELMF